MRVLHLAASTSQALVESSLERLLEGGGAWDYATLKALAQPEAPIIPSVEIGTPDLATYDELLGVEAAS